MALMGSLARSLSLYMIYYVETVEIDAKRDAHSVHYLVLLSEQFH